MISNGTICKQQLIVVMRYSAILLFFIVIHLGALCAIRAEAQSLSNTQVSVHAKNSNLKDIFKSVESQSVFAFVFNDGKVFNDAQISIDYEGSLRMLLDKLKERSPIHYEQSGGNIIVTYQAQQPAATLTGSVTDIQGQPLPGARITVKELNRSTVVDQQGHFRLTLPAGTYTVEAHFISYQTDSRTDISFAAGENKSLAFTLQQVVDSLDEIVVVGYRSQTKATLTGAVSTINMEAKANEPLTHASQALYGSTGIWVNQAGAKPGNDGTTIRIRGVNTLSGNNPLVLLDGVEYSLSEIDPADIASISVLKDAAAAIYGSKSSNGVILITSKKGHAGKSKIEFSSRTGFQEATYLPDVVSDPILYMQMRNAAERNSGKQTVTYSADQIDEYREGMAIDPSVYPATNWFDIVLDQGMIQQHHARVTGGNQQVNYTAGLGYMNQAGVFIENDDAKRYSFDLKVSAHVTDRLKIAGAITGNLRKYNEVGYGTGTVMNTLMRALPIFSDYHRNNMYGSTWLYTPGRNNIENPRMEVEQGFTKRDYQEFLSSLTVDYQLPFGVKYNGIFGYRKIDHWSKDFLPEMYTVNPKTGDRKIFNSNAPRLKDWDAYNAQYSVSHRLTWEKLFADKHQVHVMLGQDYQVNDNRNFQAYNYGFYDNSLQELNALKDQTNAQATGGSSLDKLASFYGRLAYTFDDKYLFESTFRMDGSSRFAPGNQWGFFPSVLAGWVISKENFFHSHQIDLLKLRASVGRLGNQAVAIGSYNSKVIIDNAYNYSFGGTVSGGAAVNALNDRNIKWESTLSYNVGIDLEAFQQRLSVTADYFYKRTFDILRPAVIASQVGGLAGPTLNLGKVDNKGYEIDVNYRDHIGQVDYGINGSVTYVKNKVVDIAGQQQISGRYIIKEGYSINSYYLYQANGFYQSQEEIDQASAVYGTRSKLRPGYVKYVNINNDGYIDDQDKMITGSSIPSYMFGFGAHVGYKNIVLQAQFQGVADVDVYPTANLAFPFNNGAGVTYEWARDSWAESNPDSKYPILTTATDAPENFINSTQWLQDASYIRMKNIQLGYNFPQSITKKLHISKLMVYVSGENLLTFSKFKMWDPEMTTTKGDLYEYPNLKAYTAGINLVF